MSLPQNLDQLEEALGGQPVDHTALIERMRRFFNGYAELEEKVLGETPLLFPGYLMGLELPEDPLEAAEYVAGQEAARHAMPPRDLGGMIPFLDRGELKVLCAEFPAESPLTGIFLFDKKAGPCFTVRRGLGRWESDRVLAGLYGHYLMDHDPYRIRLSGLGMDSEQTPRAAAFGPAFLLPRSEIQDLLDASGTTASELAEPEWARRLSVFFDVGHNVLALRLVALGVLEPAKIPVFQEALAALEAEPEAPDSARDWGDRYLKLALAAHQQKAINLAKLAEVLEISREAARELSESRMVDVPEDDEAP